MKRKLLLIFISTMIAIICAELFVRALGFQPSLNDDFTATLRSAYESDSLRGWRNSEGVFHLPIDPGSTNVRYDILPGGRRATHMAHSHVMDDRPKIIIVGGSFTAGANIENADTYAWKLQELFPGYEVLNYGVSGYGTYQSLLTLEMHLSKAVAPSIIIYGFIEDHEIRNVAHPSYVYRIASVSSAEVRMPYVTVDDKSRLTRHDFFRSVAFPLREYSALSSLFEFSLLKWSARERDWNISNKNVMMEVTFQLVAEMQQLSKRYGADFVMAALSANSDVKDLYLNAYQKNEIHAADCVYPVSLANTIGERDPHPNGKLNTLWANCIAGYINQQVVQLSAVQPDE